MAYSNPTVAEFQAFFTRDFPFGTDQETMVLDADIGKAFQMANMAINPELWQGQGPYTIGYMYLAAHYLVMNLRASSQGVNGQFNWLQSSKGAGALSEGFAIPQQVLDNPLWSIYFKTNYGSQYMQLMLPLLVGQVFIVRGTTQP